MQLMDKTWAMYNEEAREMYLEETKHHFAFNHFLKVVWDQPKRKRYISSLYSKKTKLSEDAEDAPEIKTGEQGSMPVKKKHEAKGKVPALSSELQEDIQCSADPQNMTEKNHKEMIEAELQCLDQKLELDRSIQLTVKDKEMVISEMQTDLLIAGTLRVHKLQHGRDGLMADISRFYEFQHGSAVREDVPENKTHPQGRKTVEHAETVRGGLPEQETYPQGSKMTKSKRKRKGDASTPPSEVQEDIKHAVDLQTMLRRTARRCQRCSSAYRKRSLR
ncbi:uncharacterized protein LOC120663706 [Panicum virgatum]|nr:uncharacterized protein LOC120663706 [Panicum virgatum]